MEALFKDVEGETQLLKSELMPTVFKRGIESLPDEILQMTLMEDVQHFKRLNTLIDGTGSHNNSRTQLTLQCYRQLICTLQVSCYKLSSYLKTNLSN